MSLEFELPLVSLIFIILLFVVYFSKKRVKLVENKTYELILIFSFFEILIDTGIHFICAMYDFSVITTQYYQLFNFLNKILSLLFIMIFSCLYCYTMMITYSKVKKNPKKLINSLVGLNIIAAVILLFTNIELVEVGLVTNVKGSTITFGYFIVAFLILGSLTIAIMNIKKFDKRYFPIFFVFLIISFLYVATLVFPGLIIYDIILTLMCYIMYFTIENPDLKMIGELNVAKSHAERANQAKTDFLSSMSHEIRTPLNAIVGFSHCILEEDNLEKAKEDAEDIIMASQNLLEIVNGILDISKIEANKMEMVEAVYEPRKMLDDLSKLVIARIGEKPIEFHSNLAVDLPYQLYGDSGKLKQIISNILTNAAKYTEEGQIDFDVSCIIEESSVKLVISVQDTGRGIKPEKIEKLFTKFERLEEDRNTTLEGTGLGLAITKRLVEMMGGKVIVQSVYGQGSKFTVYLNQKIQKLQKENDFVTEEIEIQSTERVVDFSSMKVLIVDDNLINIKVAHKLLEVYGIDAESVDSGFSCIERIEKGEMYDLILMDDMMPKMNGIETFHKLQKIPGFAIPVIALTANAIVGMKEKYMEEGFQGYLAKPIDKEELNRVLKKYLSVSKENIPKTKKLHFEPLPEEIYQIDSHSIEPVSEEKETTTKEESRVSFDFSYLKENGVDVDTALELLGDKEMYLDTMGTFLTEIDSRIEKLKEYKEDFDLSNYAIFVHSLKSDAKYLGFTRLVDIAFSHEKNAKKENFSYIKENFESLLEEVNRIISICRTFLGK